MPRLLLALPGGPPETTVATEWRAVLVGPAGDVAIETSVPHIRVSPVAARAEKQLVAALAAEGVEPLAALAQDPAEVGVTARWLLGLRLANADPVSATAALSSVLESESEPWSAKAVRRFLPGLHICVLLAPGVPAIAVAARETTVLLVAELLTRQGRYLDAVSLLGQQPLTPLTALALCAANLAIGQNESVVKMTDGLGNFDDLTALCLVARGVALRTSGRFDEALVAFDAAVAVPGRRPGMIAAALEERANLMRLLGQDLAAQADVERIGMLDGSRLASAVPSATEAMVTPEPAEPDIPATDGNDPEALALARARVRRRIGGTGIPGTFGGRHHRTFQPEVEAMLAAGQLEAAENLLLGLLDAVEDEAEDNPRRIDPTYYLTLADLFAHRNQRAEETAVLERLERAGQRFGTEDVGDDIRHASSQGAAAPGPSQPPPEQSSQPASVAVEQGQPVPTG